MNELFVKVGNKSAVSRFSHSTAYRAVTTYELKRNVEAHADCNSIVIEGVYEDEQRELKEFLSVWKRNSEHNVIFFCEENSLTHKFAIENKYEVTTSLAGLYAWLSSLGMNVSTFIADRNKMFTESTIESEFEHIASIEESDIQDAMAVEDISEEDKARDIAFEEESKLLEADIREAEKQVGSSSKVNKGTDGKAELEVKKQRLKVLDLERKYNQVLNDLKAANTKADSLEKLLRSEKDKVDTLQQRFSEIVASGDVIEDPVSLSEYQDVKEQLNDSQDRITKLKSQLSSANSLVDNLREDIAVKDSELSEARKTASKYKQQLSEASHKADLTDNEEIESLRTKSRRQERIIEDKVAEIARLNDNLDDLQRTQEDLYDRIGAESEINSLKNDIVLTVLTKMNSLTEDAKKYKEQSDLIKKELDSYKSQLEEKNKLLNTNSAEYAKMKSQVDSVESRIALATNEVRLENTKLKDTIGRLNVQIDSLKKGSGGQIEILQKEVDNYKAQLENVTKQLSKASLDLTNMRAKVSNVDTQVQIAIADERRLRENAERDLEQANTRLNATESQLKTKTMQYDNLLGSIGMDESGVQTIITENKSLQNVNSTLQSKLSASAANCETLKRNNTALQSKLKEAEESNRQLQSSLSTLSGLGKSDERSAAKVVRAIKNAPGCQIIPVIGCGSFGITSTAYTLAYKLAGEEDVLIADFDMVNPSLDAWFNKNPVFADMTKIAGPGKRGSAMGVFIERGPEIFSKVMSRVIINVEKIKGGGISYLSGIYYTPESLKLATANYEEFFNVLSEKYKNIVLDCGKLGVSELNDQIIKVISDISMRVVVVTPNDRFKARDMRTRLDTLHIDTANVSWLLNMCKTSSIDEGVRRYVGKARVSIMPFESDYFGVRDKFTRKKLMKDKFELFVSKNLFSSK